MLVEWESTQIEPLRERARESPPVDDRAIGSHLGRFGECPFDRSIVICHQQLRVPDVGERVGVHAGLGMREARVVPTHFEEEARSERLRGTVNFRDISGPFSVQVRIGTFSLNERGRISSFRSFV